MTKRMLLAILLLIVFALPAGCQKQGGEPTQPTAPAPTILPTHTPEPSPTPTPDPVGEALAGMTVEQKAAQLLVAGIEGTEPGEDAVQAVQGYQVGGVILFGRNVESAEQLAALTNGLKELNGDYTPLFLCVDQEGGRVDRMPPEVTDLPSALDIWSNPENTVIGDRAFGTDAATVTGAANETALGILSGGVIPVAKHFPGHGDTAVDSHYGLPVVDKSLEELEELELRPFRQAIDTTCVYGTYGGDTSIPAIMVAHILLSQIDPDNPASLSPEVVTGLLREEMGYEGVVCTDDLTMGAISNTYGMGEAAVLAVEAGSPWSGWTRACTASSPSRPSTA